MASGCSTRSSKAAPRPTSLKFSGSKVSKKTNFLRKSLNAEGTDYQGHLGLEDPRFLECWEHLRKVLADALHRLSRREILEAWSPDVPQPNVDTLWRWLNRAVHQGLVLRAGEGTKSDQIGRASCRERG